MTLWNIGDKPRLKIRFALNGVGTDPTTVVLTIQDPANTVTTPTVVPDGAGAFHYDLTLALAGIYRYRWTGTGTVVDTEEGEVVVVPSKLVIQPPATVLPADVITGALRLIQVTVKPGRTPSQEQMEEGMDVFNDMLNADKANGFFAFATARTVFPLAAGVQDYLIGPNVTAPNFTLPRPPSIDFAGTLISGNLYEIPIEVTTSAQRWRDIVPKLQQGFPWFIYYEKTVAGGNGTVHVWMPPSDDTYSLALYTPEFQDQVLSLTTAMYLPDGYKLGYQHTLALLLAPRYPNAKVSPLTVQAAREFRLNMMEANHQPLLRRSAFNNDRSGRTNIYTGGGIGW